MTQENLPQIFNLEAEQALLGAILVNNDCLDLVSHIKPEHFIEDIHGEMYADCVELHKKGKRADPVILKSTYDGDSRLVELGGAAYLVRLAASAASIISAPDYADTVYELYQRREVYIACAEMLQVSEHLSPEKNIIDEFTTAYNNITDATEITSSRIRSFKQIVASAMHNLDDIRENGGVLGLKTGLDHLDSRIGGLKPSKLYQVAGRPGMGKSALALFMAFHAAIDEQKLAAKENRKPRTILFFSLEMDGEENATRAIATQSAIGMHNTSDHLQYFNIDNNDLNARQFEQVKKHADTIKDLPLVICDDANLNVQAMRRICKGIKNKRGLAAVFIDYLQLMSHENRNISTIDKTTQNSGALKRLAKEFQLPVVCLSQLSRAVESRDNKRPVMSDLRDSGAIEQDADCIIFPFREEYYLQFDESPAGKEKLGDVQNTIEVIIAKQRGGRTGSFKAGCNIGANAFWTMDN